MSQKGDLTKSEILRAAKILFTQKGYASVTMSELCEATGLSRGGLYRHFSSITEVFIALLTADKDNWEEEMANAMKAGIPVTDMMAYYLEQVRISISQGEGRLSLAIYEFERSGQDKHGFLAKRYSCAVDMMERLLRYGQSRGEFRAFDPRDEAEHLVIFIDGLKMASAAIPLPPETVTRQLDNLLKQLKPEEIS